MWMCIYRSRVGIYAAVCCTQTPSLFALPRLAFAARRRCLWIYTQGRNRSLQKRGRDYLKDFFLPPIKDCVCVFSSPLADLTSVPPILAALCEPCLPACQPLHSSAISFARWSRERERGQAFPRFSALAAASRGLRAAACRAKA